MHSSSFLVLLIGNFRISTLIGSTQIKEGERKPSERRFTGVSATTFARGLRILGCWTFWKQNDPNHTVWM